MPNTTNTVGMWIARFSTAKGAGRLGFVNRDRAKAWIERELHGIIDLDDARWMVGEFTWQLDHPDDDIEGLIQHVEISDASAVIETTSQSQAFETDIDE